MPPDAPVTMTTWPVKSKVVVPTFLLLVMAVFVI